MLLTETHRLYKSKDSLHYDLVMNLLMASKALYNKANYYVRQAMFIGRDLKEGKELNIDRKNTLSEINNLIEQGNKRKIKRALNSKRSPKLFGLVTASSYYLDYYRIESMLQGSDLYKSLPAQSSQQILRQLDSNWKAFFKANTKYNKSSKEFLGRPKLPGYKKSEISNLILTGLQCKVRDGNICFPKIFKGFSIKTKAEKINQVKMIGTRYGYIKIEVIYEVKEKELLEGNKYIGIDLGVNNLAAIVTNIGLRPILINGRGLKSINQYYNKKRAYYKSILDKSKQGIKESKRLRRITEKRNNKIKDGLHKASRYIVDYAVRNGISKIVIGKNKFWKQEVNKGKQTNQNFVCMPLAVLIELITYKARLEGIEVITTEEGYTSKTSYLDNETPIKENSNGKRRVYRGLFISNKGIKINADVNGALQILRKVYSYYEVNDNLLKPIKENIRISN